MDLLVRKFDILLLTFILVYLGFLMRGSGDANFTQWKDVFNLVLGAILAIVGSTHLRKTDKEDK